MLRNITISIAATVFLVAGYAVAQDLRSGNSVGNTIVSAEEPRSPPANLPAPTITRTPQPRPPAQPKTYLARQLRTATCASTRMPPSIQFDCVADAVTAKTKNDTELAMAMTERGLYGCGQCPAAGVTWYCLIDDGNDTVEGKVTNCRAAP